MYSHFSQLKATRFTSRIRHKPVLIVVLLMLFVLVTTAVAQEADPPDGPVPYVPDGQIVSVTELPYGVQAQIDISANKDSFLSSLKANSNYGSRETMGLGYASGSYNAMRTLMEFNINAIPANAIINKAEIWVYQDSVVPTGDRNMDFRAQYMKSQWNEYSVTWNNANYLGGDEIGVGSISSSLGWKTGDVTDLVERWYSGAQPNYGFIMTGDESVQPNRSRVFRSREYSGSAPFIRVDYTQCNDATPPTASMVPLPTWSPQSFLVQWGGTDHSGSGIAWYDVQYNTNGSGWVTWKSHTSSTSSTFSDAGNGAFVQFRTRAADNCGNVGGWTGTTSTSVDTQAPNVVVNPLPQITITPSFIVSWSGSDNGSGINNMDVQVRDVADGNWNNWINGTTQFSATFTGGQNGHTYQFRARGTDNVGNKQSWGNAQAETTMFFEPIAVILPFPSPTTSDNPFEVKWQGATPTGDLVFDIYVRFDGGPWSDPPWKDDVPETSGSYTPSGNGIYEFAAVGKNNLGQEENWDGKPEQAILYNSDPNAFTFQYLPIIFN